MIREISGPQLRDRIRIRCEAYATYAYLDGNNRRASEYLASRIGIKAYHADMSPELLVELERRIAALPGCLSTERIVAATRADLRRPQVAAVFDRQAALDA
jgi:hypothetical protein